MANDIENKENEIEDESINIDDIEGLERDLPLNEQNSTPKNTPLNSEDIEPLEILPEGKLKTSQTEDTTSLNQEATKKNKLKELMQDKKNIVILLIILALLIIAIIAFIYLSPSEKEPIEQQPPVATKTQELPPLETYSFKLDHINVSRLNKKLEHLTKYELLGMTEEEYLKEEKLKALRKAQEEEELKLRLEQEAQEKLALEKAKEKEELAQQEKLKLEQETVAQEEQKEANEQTAQENSAAQESSNMPENQNSEEAMAMLQENNGKSFLKFIQINTNKKVIYKSYLKELKVIDSRINPCRNINNYIEVFIGPLNDDEDSMPLIDAIKKAQVSKSVLFIELTKEEFAKRCMVYDEN